MSKYLPLSNHLSNLEKASVELTFSEIESILNSRLPPTAYNYPAWWANSRTNDSHTWAHLWISAGWEVSLLDISNQTVNFIKFQSFEIESQEALEGYNEDRIITSNNRNLEISKKRKVLDKYTCQVCNFQKQVNGKWIIEVHHLSPLSITGETITSINDLVSLCPTCHRIAHTKKPPYNPREIKKLLHPNKE